MTSVFDGETVEKGGEYLQFNPFDHLSEDNQKKYQRK